MNFATINPALCTLASKITGVEAGCCVFEDAPRPRSNGSLAILSWVSPGAAVGIDATRWAFESHPDAPLTEMTPTVGGDRIAVLQIAVETTASWTAAEIAANRARTLLRAPSSLAALRAVGLALATVGPTTRAPYTADNRRVARSLFEVRLNAVDEQADTDGRTSYIATVEVTGAVVDPAGTDLPDSIQPTITG
jgi:hypothetical protein